MLNNRTDLFPAASAAVTTTSVLPSGNKLPLGCE